ncbi:MAG: hypothetical protein M3T56_11515 [Chloroflexota bacterium]|nr:hypothetical protein [Chloroflexota bacterium]
MFFEEPFPKSQAWAEANLSGSRLDGLREHREDVSYHLALGANAERVASDALRPGQWGLAHDGSAVYLIGFDPVNIVRYGDITIREAATALDMGLQFTNAALALGVGKNDVRWGRGKKEAPLRRELRALASSEAADLVAVIDALFGSIGLHLLHGYRHWVTHRGAPRVRIDHALAAGIPLGEEIRDETDERRRAWLIETKLLTEIPAAMWIECHPFVPPVQAVVNLNVEEATEDIDIPGVIHIGKGAKNIEISDMTIASGSAMESLEDFTAKNPILREESQVRVSGEDLAVYKPWDYLHALSFAMRFVGEALTGAWDERIAIALAAHGGVSGESDDSPDAAQ